MDRPPMRNPQRPKRRKNPTPLKRPNPRTAMDAPARRIGITGKKGRRPVRMKGRRAVPVRMSGRGMRLRTAAGATRSGAGPIARAARLRTSARGGRTAGPSNRGRTRCLSLNPAGRKRRERKWRFRLALERSSDFYRRDIPSAFFFAVGL